MEGTEASQRELLERVASSVTFQKATRLRELLLFVCERALRDPEGTITEQEIASAVFGRSEGFDPGQDALVRVQTSQLRRRLQHYFVTEGRGEALVIEIPKGTYVPSFRERTAGPSAPVVMLSGALAKIGASRLLMVGAAGLIALAAGVFGLFLGSRSANQRLTAPPEPPPAVHRLWRQILANGRKTYVVLADGTLSVFQDVARRSLSATEYQRQQFKSRPETKTRDPRVELAQQLVDRPFTGWSDAALAHHVGRLGATYGAAMEVILAREARPEHFRSHNVVISGPRRANPWTELFEDRLNFQSRFDKEANLAYLENVSPLGGEQPRYKGTPDQTGYCRVAYLPNLDGTGSVLLVSGTEMAATEAGVDFVTNERWMTELLALLRLREGEPFPHFEVLLRVSLVPGVPVSFERLAHRVGPSPAPRP